MMWEDALAELEASGDATRAADMAAYHKAHRRYLGVPNPEIDRLTRAWRMEASIEMRVDLARALWDSDIHEARIAAAKLLTQARIRPDDAVWQLICAWVPTFDAWAIADHAMIAGQKRLVADPARIETVECWTTDAAIWVRRAALVITLPFAKMNHPKPDEFAIRARALGWLATYCDDRNWFIQKAIASWLADLSKHDPEVVRMFLGDNGARMKSFARKEAARHLRH